MTRRQFALLAASLFMLTAVAIFSAAPAFAQSTATFQGTVLDAQGAAVAGAKVTIKNVATNLERSVETDGTGNFSVPALPPGNYRVEVAKTGFRTYLINSFILEVGTTASQNITLSIGEVAQTVEVTSAAPVIDSSEISVGQVINQRTVQEIPLNGRHFVDLALLIPGTVTPPQNGFLTAPLRGQGSFQFNTAGNREDAVNFMINGINLNDMVQNQVTFQPTINTVSEFKVDNSTYSAEYGRNSGAIVNIATRSGTNEFHGEAFEFVRNNVFDARNFFNPRFVTVAGAQTPNAQSAFKRNQFGADGGGPIWKGHTYFYLSYEGLRQRQGLTTATNVLTDAQRTTIQNGTNQVAKGLLAFIPAANGTLNGAPAFLGSATAPVDINQGTADVSHNFNNADHLHVYYVFQHDLRREATAGTNIPGFGDTREGQRQVLTINETHIFNSTLINEFRVGANRIHITFNTNAPIDPTTVGINLGPQLPVGLPSIRISDIGLLFGGERNFPQGRGDTTYVVADTLNYIRGRHSFKFGVEFRDFRNNNFNNDPGSLTFNTTTNFINGTVNTAARTVGSVASRINQNALDFFAQDSFKVRPYFTLELGFRYAWNMTPSEAKDRFVVFDPSTISLVRKSDPYAQNNANLQPRVGFAWDIFHNGKTVLRGAYAIQVDQPVTGIVTALSSNPPFALPISVNNQSVSSLSATFNGTPASVTPSAVDPNFKNAGVQSWNLNIQREITPTLGIMVGYFGSKGTHLELDRNINQFRTLGTSSSRPFAALSSSSPILPGVSLGNTLAEFDSSSNSTYNALWLTANKRVSKGLQFNASYTYSHSIDEVSRNREGLFVQDGTNIFASRGSSDFDARHRFVINAIYDLPFKGNRLIEGWAVAPIVSLQSGNPFTLVLATTTVTGAGNTVRPNVSGPVQTSGSPSQWIVNASSVFSSPGNAFGNLGRNTVVGPDFKNLDLALIKNTKITERVSLQFRVDGFDLFNHPNFGQPGPVAGNGATIITIPVPSTFSTISSTRFPVGDSGSARQLQLALKLQF